MTTTVRISYDPDLSKIGTIREVDAVEARRLVSRGRAVVIHAPQTKADAPATVTKPETMAAPKRPRAPRARKPKG